MIIFRAPEFKQSNCIPNERSRHWRMKILYKLMNPFYTIYLVTILQYLEDFTKISSTIQAKVKIVLKQCSTNYLTIASKTQDTFLAQVNFKNDTEW